MLAAVSQRTWKGMWYWAVWLEEGMIDQISVSQRAGFAPPVTLQMILTACSRKLQCYLCFKGYYDHLLF